MVNTRVCGECISALVAAVMAALLFQGQGQFAAGLSATGIMPQWALMAGACSLAYVLYIAFNAQFFRSLARFLSGCIWGAIVLVCMWVRSLDVIFWSAAALFSFDFYAVLKGGMCQKSKCSATG